MTAIAVTGKTTSRKMTSNGLKMTANNTRQAMASPVSPIVSVVRSTMTLAILSQYKSKSSMMSATKSLNDCIVLWIASIALDEILRIALSIA